MAAAPLARAVVKATRDGLTAEDRALAEECPVAMVFDGGTQAVMMATPRDLKISRAALPRPKALSQAMPIFARLRLSATRRVKALKHGFGLMPRNRRPCKLGAAR